jgi:aconitate hydratase
LGVLPLQFQPGENAASLGLTGKETFHVAGIAAALSGATRKATVRAVADGGSEKTFQVDVRVDTPQEAEYYRNGGILPFVLRQLAGA